MRIALVVDRFDPQAGGLEQWTCSLAGFLAARGHDVHVLTFLQAAHALPVTVHVLPLPLGRLDIVARARLVARAVAGLGAAVVHDTGTGWSGDVFHPQTGSRRLSQARLVATHPPLLRLRALVSPVSIGRRWQMARLERRQVRGARRVIAVSRRVRAQLVAQHGLPERGIAVIHNGVDTARFAPERLACLRQGARDRLGLGGAVTFLAAAYNLHLKGLDTALRALAQLVGAGAEVRLLVAGGTPDAGWLGLASRLGVRERVAFLGPVAAMESLFAAADALVHPTRWDACSLSVIEAGAAGLPVITTAMDGAAELVADECSGYVLPDPEDAGALAARMHRLLDPAVRRRLGAAAHVASAAHDLRHNLAAVEAVLIDAARIAG